MNPRIQVDQATRTATGWMCQCSDGLDREVLEAELLAHLDADKYDTIACVDSPGEIDERHYCIHISEWLEENAGLPLDIELALIIDKREGRKLAAPLRDMPDAFAQLQTIIKSFKAA